MSHIDKWPIHVVEGQRPSHIDRVPSDVMEGKGLSDIERGSRAELCT